MSNYKSFKKKDLRLSNWANLLLTVRLKSTVIFHVKRLNKDEKRLYLENEKSLKV